MKKKDIIFFGYNILGLHVMKYFKKKGYNIPLVIAPPKILKKKIKDIRDTLPNARIIDGGSVSNNYLVKEIKRYKNWVLVSCAYNAIIPRELIRLGIVNVHGGILPQWRGGNTLNWMIIENSPKGGVVLHHMAETIDSGDTIDMITYPIYYTDDINSVKRKTCQKIDELLDRTWERFLAGKIKPKRQDHILARYYPARRPKDGRIDWKKNAIDIYNLVRGLVRPYPGAYSYIGREKIVFDKVRVEIDNKYHSRPGEILSTGKKGIFRVLAGYNIIVVKKIRNINDSRKRLIKKGAFFR